ncbi:hypothetical protein TYRP_022279 [Tyrophagus putrescentiae]|nr:hypothetical protein TYRP_022279 [Tyrophagus putrescentiae]
MSKYASKLSLKMNSQVQHLKSPLFKLSLAVFGNFSVQFYPLNFNAKTLTLPTLINLCWNLFLVILVLFKSYDWVMETYEYYEQPGLGQMYSVRRSKPLFAFLTLLAERYYYPVTTVINYVYFFCLSFDFQSSSLSSSSPKTFASCLDALLPEKYCSKAKSKQIFVQFFIFYNALFALSNYKIIVDDPSKLNFAYTTVSVYFLVFNRYVVAVVVHYFQFATAEVAKLAALNEHLSLLLSTPLFIFVVAYVIDTLNGTVYMLSHSDNRLQPYHIQPSVHLLLIAYLEWKIYCQLKKLDFLLKQEALVNNFLLSYDNTWKTFDLKSSSFSSKRFYQFTLVSQYERYFRLRLFSSLTHSFDWAFLCQMILFLLHYCVIMMQTST